MCYRSYLDGICEQSLLIPYPFRFGCLWTLVSGSDSGVSGVMGHNEDILLGRTTMVLLYEEMW
jgi:hypothetical protein